MTAVAVLAGPLAAPTINPNSASPGVAGFLVVFALALAFWLLMRSMSRHLRKARHEAQRRAEADEGVAVAAPGGAPDGEAPPA